MSTDPFDKSGGNPNWTQPAAKRGMSKTTKILLVLGVLAGLALVVCCGGLMIVGWRLQSYMAEAVSTEPAVIEAAKDEIVQIDIPETFSPQMSFDMKVPFVEQRVFMAVVYTMEGVQGNLMLMAIGPLVSDTDREQFTEQMKEAFQQQGGQGQGNVRLEVAETLEREFEIRGQPTKFRLQKGKNPDSGTEMIELSGTFSGKSGPVILMLTVEADRFDEEQITTMIESIR